MKLITLGWNCIQPDSSHLICFTSKIWSWNALWATYIPEKQFGFFLGEKCCKLVNHLCNLDGQLIFERGGHVFHIKDKSRTSISILKNSSTTWWSEDRRHLQLVSTETFSRSECLSISKLEKLAQVAGSRAERGRCRALALSATPFCDRQLKPDQQLFCKILFLQKSSSIKKKNICNKLNIQSSLPTKSRKFRYHRRTVFSW